MPERHTVVHLGTAFHKLGFALGAEVLLKPVVGSRRHLDLLVHSGDQTFLFEVKTFGSWKFSEVLWDVERLCEFGIDGENEGPQTVPFTEGNPLKLPIDSHRDFWESSNERWGCVVIQCFRDEKFGKRWAGFDTRSILCEAPDDYRLFGPAKTKELNELKKALTTLDARFGVINVAPEFIVDTGALYLVWAAFDLRTPQAQELGRNSREYQLKKRN